MSVLEDVASLTDRRDTRIESLLREWQLDFEFEAEFAVTGMDHTYAEVQVRGSQHRALPASVKEYAAQMRAGALFPPVIVTQTGKVIDGNTRYVAAKECRMETFPAYVVTLPSTRVGMMVGAAVNQMGGKRLDPAEAYAAAELMFKEGLTDENITRAIGRSRKQVSDYRRQHEFEEHAVTVGLTSSLGAVAKRQLARVKNDRPFVALVKAASEVKATPKDLDEVVETIVNARSEDNAVEAVKQFKKEHKPLGVPPARTPQGASLAKRAARHAQAVLAITNAPDTLALAVLAKDHEPMWRELHAFSGKVMAAYAEVTPGG